jgi:hypothetical protein
MACPGLNNVTICRPVLRVKATGGGGGDVCADSDKIHVRWDLIVLIFSISLGVLQVILLAPPESVRILAEELGQVRLHLGEVHERPLQALQLLARVLKYQSYVICVI